MKKMVKYLVWIFFIFFVSCKPHQEQKLPKNTERAFYFWKSVFKLTDHEKDIVDSLHVSTIYLKFFDVEWNEANRQPNPVAQLSVADKDYLQKINIIPVVFITNESILKIDSLQSIPFAEKICKLLNEMAAINKLTKINELQIDCDWTASTKEKYFTLLKKIKQLTTPWKLSATIRMHQVKFMEKSGVPPVDKGLLMCYNMGNLRNPATNNSIIETAELKKYIGNVHKYPLPLDVAFSLFDWYVLFRNENYSGLIKNMPDSVFKNSFSQRNENRFTFLKDTFLMGYQFKKNDVLRYENSDYNSIISSAKDVNNKLTERETRVSLYHLDSITLSKYTIHEMENIYNSIH
ncbi:MAG: hypothetical protein ABI402_04200 [Ferruginibacter sp.]